MAGGREGESGGREGEKGRAGGGNRGEGVENGGRAGNLKNFAAPPSMRLWCDPQLGDEGRVSDINMRRVF